MVPLAPRPQQTLRELESLQESERKGVEGDVAWRGHGSALREVISWQAAQNAIDKYEDEQKQRGLPVDFEQLQEVILRSQGTAQEELDNQAREVERKSALGREPEMWSRYEYPPASNALRSAAERIEEVIAAFANAPKHRIHWPWSLPARRSVWIRRLARDRKWSLPENRRPAIGTLSTGQFTAVAQSVPGEGTVILVENGLFPLAHALAQVGMIGAHEALEDGRLSEPTVQAVSDIVASYVTLGHTIGINIRKTPPVFSDYVSEVADALLIFVLAHEYAHILNGDTETHPLSPSSPPEEPREGMEFDADIAALRMTAAVFLTSPTPGAAMSGAMLYLAGQDLLDRADAAMRHEAPAESGSLNYPTPYERAVNLANEVESSKELLAPYSAAMRLAMNAYHAVLFAWDVVMPALWQLSDELSAGSALDSLDEYKQLAAMTHLWSAVRPRVASQQRIIPI